MARIHHVLYHDDENDTTVCGKVIAELPEDEVVHTLDEVRDHLSGIHFNCVDCHKVMTGGQKHSRPPDGDWDHEKPDA